MKIAFVNQPLDAILPPSQNSIGIWTYEVGRRLASAHDVTVFGPKPGGLRSRSPRSVDDRCVSYRFSHSLPLRAWGLAERFWARVFGGHKPLYASVIYYFEFVIPVAIRLRRLRPDVIHIHNFTGFVPWIRRLNPATPIVLHMNCEWLSQLDEATMARRIAQVDEVFGASDHITNLISDRFPQFADRCRTVYNGVDPDSFVHGERRRDDHVVVFVGRISPEKGVHDLIDAMRSVLARCPDALLDLIGPISALSQSYIIDVSGDEAVRALSRFYDRPYGQDLAERAEPIADSVRFLGMKSHDDVVEHVAAASVLVNPSYSESFGMSLVEAMACGTPVVATRVGGMKEIVDDATGILVETGEPEQLADAVVALLNDPARRTAMGAAGRRRVVAMFAWDRVAEIAVGRYAAIAGETDSGG